MSIFKAINRNPSRRDLLEFGLILAAGMGVLGALNHYEVQLLFIAGKPERALIFWTVGAVALVLSQFPPLGRPLYILWMGFGLVIGFFTSPVIIFLLYMLLIVPVGIFFKVLRRDAMRRKIDTRAVSYWEDYSGSDDPASYIRQY